ncbi:pilus assembly protein TadG [Vibrio cholerae]|nr:pilus assembly protein TadG [Vibrio cholerae]
MRGLTSRTVEDGEQGAVSVIMAVMLVALLGFTALAVDVGMLYAERAQLQNGADAAALGVAQVCAKAPSSTDCSSGSPIATNLANANANDRLAALRSVDVNPSTNTATVTTMSRDASRSDGRVSLFFARVFGDDDAAVSATASARWGSPLKGTTVFPMTVSLCQVENRVDGAVQLLQLHGTTSSPGPNGVCTPSSSGQVVPGGFGWLTQAGTSCGGFIDLALQQAGGAPGNSGPGNCNDTYDFWKAEITAGRKPVILIPVFWKVDGTGSGAIYRMNTFAAYEITGWKFSGGNEGVGVRDVFHNTAAHSSATTACTGDCRGIIGKFVKYVSLSEGYTLGPVNQFGATIVQMSG